MVKEKTIKEKTIKEFLAVIEDVIYKIEDDEMIQKAMYDEMVGLSKIALNRDSEFYYNLYTSEEGVTQLLYILLLVQSIYSTYTRYRSTAGLVEYITSVVDGYMASIEKLYNLNKEKDKIMYGFDTPNKKALACINAQIDAGVLETKKYTHVLGRLKLYTPKKYYDEVRGNVKTEDALYDTTFILDYMKHMI